MVRRCGPYVRLFRVPSVPVGTRRKPADRAGAGGRGWGGSAAVARGRGRAPRGWASRNGGPDAGTASGVGRDAGGEHREGNRVPCGRAALDLDRAGGGPSPGDLE